MPRTKTAKKKPPPFPLTLGKYQEPRVTEPLTLTAEWEGRSFALCRWNNHYVLFRPEDWNSESTAQCILQPVEGEKPDETRLEQHWREGMQSGAGGLMALYSPDFADGGDALHLFFAPNGTGFVIDDQEKIDFAWDRQELPPEILSGQRQGEGKTGQEEGLQRLCAGIVETQINPKLSNPFVRPEERQPVARQFACGSENELRLLTIMACQTEPELFANQKPATAIYRADLNDEWRIFQLKASGGASRRLTRLCRLIFEHNRFTGLAYNYSGNKPLCRARHYQWDLVGMDIAVSPPSAHEQAEALLTLAEWLDGKVTEEERRELLEISDENYPASG